jgi:AcrR family transcriptional regulator
LGTAKTTMPTRKRKSTTRRDLVANRILDEAASLFAERGFSETSLQEVADALEISRTALYHYIGGKDELLATLVRGMAQQSAEALEPLEKLRQVALSMTTRIGSSPARFRMLLLSEGSIAEPIASEHHKARRRILEAVSDIIEQGVASGDLRPVDTHVAAFALLGMCNWVAWWFQPDRPRGQTPESIAETIAEITINGLRTGEGDPSNGTNAADRALARIRSDLNSLEVALGAKAKRKPSARRAASSRAKRR